jgi:hypothetical protein
MPLELLFELNGAHSAHFSQSMQTNSTHRLALANSRIRSPFVVNVQQTSVKWRLRRFVERGRYDQAISGSDRLHLCNNDVARCRLHRRGRHLHDRHS